MNRTQTDLQMLLMINRCIMLTFQTFYYMKFLTVLIFVIALSKCSPKLAPDAGWGGRQQWIVVEMKRVPVQQSGGRRDAHIVFEVLEKTFRGNGGCNQISGNYNL